MKRISVSEEVYEQLMTLKDEVHEDLEYDYYWHNPDAEEDSYKKKTTLGDVVAYILKGLQDKEKDINSLVNSHCPKCCDCEECCEDRASSVEEEAQRRWEMQGEDY